MSKTEFPSLLSLAFLSTSSSSISLSFTVDRIVQVRQQIQRDTEKATNKTDLLVELKKIASEKGFIISDNQGGGDCMFHALSEQLNLVKGIDISHKELRKTIVRYLKTNPKLVSSKCLNRFSFLCTSDLRLLKQLITKLPCNLYHLEKI